MADYPNYQGGTLDGQATGVASIGGLGAWKLGSEVSTKSSTGATRNKLDDGAGNMVVVGSLTVTGGIINGGATAATFTATSASAFQNLSGQDEFITIPLTGATGATYTVSIGNTAGASLATIANALPLAALTSDVIGFPLPSTWYAKVTTVTGTIGIATSMSL